MITKELKHTLDSLHSVVHEQARELVKTWKTANDRIINEIFELSEEENDELQQIADEAKGKLFTLLFGPLYHHYVSQYVLDQDYFEEEEQFIEDLSKYYNLCIKNQLIKLCDHPEWFNDMLTIWDNNPEEPHTAIRNYLSHVQLNGLLENTKIVHVSFNGDEPKPGFYFEIPKDPNMYLILGILDEDERPRTVLLGKPKFNPQLN